MSRKADKGGHRRKTRNQKQAVEVGEAGEQGGARLGLAADGVGKEMRIEPNTGKDG